MKIGDEVYIHGYIDEIRHDTVIIKNDGGYFGTVEPEIVLTQPEPCEDAVSRKAVYDAMVEKGQRSRRYKLGEIWELNGTEIREALDTVPSVTPEQKRGKWEEKAVSDEKVIDEWQSARCSACGKYHTAPYMYYFNNYNFCPNCGCDMRGEDE